MRKKLLVASLALCLPATSALAVGWRDVATTGAVSASVYSTIDRNKLVYAAQDDASSFVASGGAIRGPYLEAALQRVRSENPQLQADDMALATAILSAPEQFGEAR